MLNRRPSVSISRNGSFRMDNVSLSATVWIRNLSFALFVVLILVFTVCVANYQPWFLKFTSISTFKSDSGVVKTDEGFAALINITGVDAAAESDSDLAMVPIEPHESNSASENGDCKIDDPINCSDVDAFRALMRAVMEAFRDVRVYRFGKPVRGENESSCHMAWQFGSKDENVTALGKDFRSFTVEWSENCTVRVSGIGEHWSGRNAMRRKNGVDGFKNNVEVNSVVLPDVGEVLNDGLLDVGLEELEESSFSSGKYLVYSGGGDRCKSLDQYLWSFMCMLGEAVYLNRTLVMDLNLCLSKSHTTSGRDEEGKDFRSYFDFEHLMDTAQVMEQSRFWREWGERQRKDGLSLHFVDDLRVTPMKLADVEDTLVMRKFGPDNYWYEVCEGEAKFVVSRPWRKLWKARQLLDIAFAIAARLNWDYVGLHVERGDKVTNKELWPNLDRDTSPDALLSTLRSELEEGSNVYITTNEANASFFNPLKEKYATHFLDEYKDLWDSNSDWYEEMRKLNNGNPVEFDSYMRASVDMEVFLRSKKRIETFNDLTKDCKDGVNTCTASG